MCGYDMRELEKVFVRECYVMLILNKIVNDFNSVKFFSKYDLILGYYYLELDEDLRYIIIFLIYVWFYYI